MPPTPTTRLGHRARTVLNGALHVVLSAPVGKDFATRQHFLEMALGR